MNNNEQIIRALYNILRRERETGFEDKAVIGGLDDFLRNNAAALRPMLAGSTSLYADMSPPERSEWAGMVVARMRRALADAPSSQSQTPPDAAARVQTTAPPKPPTPKATESRRPPPKPKPPIPEQAA